MLFASTTLVTLLTTNKNINLWIHNITLLLLYGDIHTFTAHVSNFTLVGIEITNVDAVKYARVSTSNLDVNIWCPHTTNPINAKLNIDQIILRILTIRI